MKVLITGASGYLGSLTARHLVSRKMQVIGIDVREYTGDLDPHYYKHYQCCVTNKAELSRILSETKPFCVIHFACTFNKIRDREKESKIDVGGSVNLLDAVVSTSSVKQIIYSSSASVYGGHPDNPDWIDEKMEARTNNYSYSLNKRKIEEIYLSENRREDLRTIVARISFVIGPSFSQERVALILLTRFPFLPRLCKNNRIQLLHEYDFVNVMQKLVTGHPEKGIYNVAPDSCSLVSELAPGKYYPVLPYKFIKAILWILWNLRLMNLQPESLDPGLYPIVMDPSKIKRQLKCKFRYTTKLAFEDTLKADNSLPVLPKPVV